MIAPTIQTAIEEAVDSAIEMLRSSILNDIVSSNVQLKKTIDEQIKISEQQNKIIKEQADKLDEKTKIINVIEKKKRLFKKSEEVIIKGVIHIFLFSNQVDNHHLNFYTCRR